MIRIGNLIPIMGKPIWMLIFIRCCAVVFSVFLLCNGIYCAIPPVPVIIKRKIDMKKIEELIAQFIAYLLKAIKLPPPGTVLSEVKSFK